MCKILTDEELYQKAKKRVKKENDYNIVVELEKEIDYYRNTIQDKLEENITWFKVNQNTDSEQLHNFLLRYVPMGEVINLYRLLKKDLEV